MLSIKRLTRKLGRQSLNEVKPAPLSETVDHTLPFVSEIQDDYKDTPNAEPLTCDTESQRTPKRSVLALSPHLSTDSSSDSEGEENHEQIQKTKTRTRGRLRSPRKKSITSELKIERVSSAEKRKYSQYKCSTGSSSSASSSDDEIKEAFEGHSYLRQTPCVPPQCPSYSWTLPNEEKPSQAFMWNPDPFVANRPLKVVPVGHRKPKFFAQMTASRNARPHLDFNKMQHSKRLIMVRKPVVIRSNSKIHSMHRPPTLQVSLDISKHSFQPVLTQT